VYLLSMTRGFLYGDENICCMETAVTGDGKKFRYFRILCIVFFAAVLILFWGKTTYYWGGRVILSIGGNAAAQIYPLFALCLCYRAAVKDWGKPVFWRDPLFIFLCYLIISPLWASLHDFSEVKGTLIPALLGYWTGCYLLSRNFNYLSVRYIQLLAASVALLIMRGIFELIFIPETVAIMHSTSEHHTIIAMLIVIAFPLLIYLISITPAKDPTRIPLYLCTALFLSGIFLTSSRLGWIAFFVLCLFYVLTIKDLRTKIAAIVLPLLVFIALLHAMPQFQSRFFSLARISHDRETSTRMENWKICQAIIREHLPVGIGFSNREYLKCGRELDSHFQYEHPHNIFLQVQVCGGIVGTALLFVLLWKVGSSLSMLYRKGRHGLFICFLASMIAFLVMNMGDTILNSHRGSLFAGLSLAYLFACAGQDGEKEGAATEGAAKEGAATEGAVTDGR